VIRVNCTDFGLFGILKFFLYSVDRWPAAPRGHAFSVYPMNQPSKQTGLAPPSRAFAVLFFFMGNFGFLICIMTARWTNTVYLKNNFGEHWKFPAHYGMNGHRFSSF